MMGLQKYLTFCNGALERQLDFPVVHIVIGNEACDLDSAVSTVTYAFYLHETSTAPAGTALFLPVLNIRRSEFPLRTEVKYFLGKYGITSADLVFKDDLDLMEVKAATDLKVTLVDRHVLPLAMSGLERDVVQIIDHRPLEGDLPDRVPYSTIEPVGSCCTLIAEALLSDGDFTMDAVTAALLHGTIVTDTINFSPIVKKTTPKDQDMEEKLRSFLPPGVENEAVFQEIKTAKFDLSGLTTEEILLKDLKVIAGDSLTVAMSSVTMEMTGFTGRADFLDSMRRFASDQSVDAVVVLTVSVEDEGSMSRQLGIFSPSRVYREQMAEVLNTSQSPNLQLSPLNVGHEEFVAFTQGDVTASRKQILPIIKSFLSGDTTPDENQSNSYDLPKDRPEGFTSMSSIVGSRQSSSSVEISSEDLISREPSLDNSDKDNSYEEMLPSCEKKIFDPLSSVHSSDSVSSPSEFVSEERGFSGEGANNKKVIVGAELETPFCEKVNSSQVPKETEGSFDTGVSFVSGADIQDDDVMVDEMDGATESEGASGDASSKDDPFGDLTDVTADDSSTHNPFMDTPPAFNIQQAFSAGDVFIALPTHRENNPVADPSMHNGLGDELDDLDPLSLAAPHEILFPPDSPADFSAATSGQTSGQTSGHGSKAPSYPVTPPNSYMESEIGIYTKETHLPSFNSSEMVEKIHEKKAALEAGAGEDNSLEGHSPFTPANSFVESGFASAYAKETQLPSFHSSDMVERIREKRSSMEREIGADADFDGGFLDVAKNPFTPHNSFVDASFDKYAREHLPSLNSAEIANRIKQKQAEMATASSEHGGTTPENASPPAMKDANGSGSPLHPYTPQNSYMDTPLVTLDSRVTDLHEVAERLSGSESSGSLNEPKSIKVSNKVHYQGLSSQDDPEHPFSDEKVESAGDNISEHFEEVSSDSDKETQPAKDEQDEEEEASFVPRRGIRFAEDGPDFEEQEEEVDNAAIESAIQKIAYDLANEMIQKALETFPSASVKELVPEAEGELSTHSSISEDSSPTMDRSDREFSLPRSQQHKSSQEEPDLDSPVRESGEDLIQPSKVVPVESGRKLSQETADEESKSSDSSAFQSEERSEGEGESLVVDSHLSEEETDDTSPSDPDRAISADSEAAKEVGYKVETEYLRDMEMRVNRYSQESTVIETDADKEVVESSSFRKISGQENQTVQEDILEQIRQEALERTWSKMRQSSLAEEDRDKDKNASDNADDESDGDNMNRDDSFVSGGKGGDGGMVSEERTKIQWPGSNDPFGASADDDYDEEGEDEFHGGFMGVDPLGALTSSPIKQTATSSHPDLEPTLPTLEQELAEAKRKVVPDSDISQDDSLTGEDGKKLIHVIRDRELYAIALNNVSVGEEFELKSSGPPESADSMLDRSEVEEKDTRKKLAVSGLDESSLLEGEDSEHRFESFAESGSLSMAEAGGEGIVKAVSKKGDHTAGTAKKVERTVSAASDVSIPGSQKGDRLKGVELTDEWQDDELPNVIFAEGQELIERPATLGAAAESDDIRKKVVPESGLAPQADNDLKDVPVVESDSEFDSDMDNDQLEWENDTPVRTPNELDALPVYTAEEERRESLMWKMVHIGDMNFQLDMKIIEPYKRVLSHGGYYGDGLNAMIVFSGCYLPSKDRKDYSYVMDHLFHYVIHTLDELVADDYMIVYFHGATPRRQMPSFGWLKRCYQCIDRKLKKNLKALYLVHPTLWLKTIILMTRPFISSKFSSKLQFVRTLDDLKRLIPMEYVYIPEQVQSYDKRHFHSSPPPTLSSNQ